MKAIILAAGYATRLGALTENFPKPLLPVGGKPILDWLLEDTAEIVEAFVVVSNHRYAENFRAWAAGRRERIQIIDDGTMNNEERLGAVKDLQLAAREICGDTLVMAGDNVLDFSLVPFVSFSRAKGASCVMCYEEADPNRLRRSANVTVDEKQRITSFTEKPPEPKSNLAVPAFYYYTYRDIQRIPEALDSGCNADAPGSFAAWLSQRTEMYAWKMPGKRHDIGNLKSYEAVKDSYRGIPE